MFYEKIAWVVKNLKFITKLRCHEHSFGPQGSEIFKKLLSSKA
jgi:hypothetical protein